MSVLEARFRLRRGAFELQTDIALPTAGIKAFFGPSGSGKTTLLRCLAGLERPAGRLALDGMVWQDDEQGLYIPAHKRSVGYVFQDARLFPHLSVRGNLEYGWRRLPAGSRPDRQAVVELLGLSGLLSRRPDQLSGGERQRVAIGRALLADPKLLLMDEPLSALDRARKEEILPYLDQLHDRLQIPVCYVSHDLEEVTRLADHLVCIEQGKVLAAGPTAELLARLDLPLAHRNEATSLIDTVVARHDPEYHLTELEFAGGIFHVRQLERDIGRAARVRVHARDVSLTLERPTGTSILNLFPVRVEALAEDGPAQMMVRLDATGTPLLSRITRRSCTALGIEPGKMLYAQVKSVALAD